MIPDNYDAWETHERRQAEAEKELPMCDHCTEYIHDENYYDIDGIILCPECLDAYYKKNTDDFNGGIFK